ncbi:MAG: translocation/assembly module TamB domain-containing protein [Chitinophagales bacterium]
MFLFFLIIFGAAIILLQQPNIQTYVSNKILDRIESNNEGEASIDRVHLKFPKSLVVDGFLQLDEQGDTLLYAQKLTVNFNLLKPFKKQIHIANLKLDGTKINLIRKEGEEDFNFSFLLKANKDGITTKNKEGKKPLELKLGDVQLKDVQFRMIDEGKLAINNAYLKKLDLDIKQFDLVNKEIHFNKILLDEPNITYEKLGDHPKEQNKSITALLPNLGWQLKVDDIALKDGHFLALNDQATPAKLPINLAALDIDKINVQVKDIQLDTALTLDIKQISLTDNQHINLKKLEGKFTISNNSIQSEGLSIALNNSTLQSDATINILDFNDWINESYQKSTITAYITPVDANLFFPTDKKINTAISLHLQSSGSINNLSIGALNIRSDKAKLLANGNIKNITDFDRIRYSLRISTLQGSTETINKILPWLVLPEQVSTLGNVSVSGTLNGTSKSVVGDLNVESSTGNLITNIEVKKVNDELVYKGDITLPNINVQQFIADVPVGNIGGSFHVEGVGNSFETLNGNVKGKLFSFEYQDYLYEDIVFNGTLVNKIFNGDILINDQNIDLDFSGMLDLSDSIPSINSRMNIDHIDLQALHLTDKPFVAKLEGDVQLTGNTMDNLNGQFNLSSLHLKNASTEVDFDTTTFIIESSEFNKSYKVINDKMVAHVEGNFDPVALPNELLRYLSDYVYYINYDDTTDVVAQHIKGSIILEEGFGLVEFFLGKVNIPENLEADFEFDNTKSIFNIQAHSNLIGYQKYGLSNFNLSSLTKDGALITEAVLDKIAIEKPNVSINYIDLSSTSTKHKIDGHLSVELEDAPNKIELKPSVNFNGDSIDIHFQDSYFKINNVLWPFNQGNQIVLKEGSIQAKDFAIFNDQQYLQIMNASSDLSEALIEFHQLSLPALANIFQLDTIIQKGALTGQVRLTDPLKNFSADVDLVFNGLQVFDYFCDSISIDAHYDKDDKMVNLAAIFDDPNYDLSAVGYYNLEKGVEEPVFLDLDVNRLYLGFLDLILKDEAHFDLHGEGKLQFKGSFAKPVLVGEAYVLDTATIGIDFLGIDLIIMPENGIREKVIFTDNTMDFQSINVRDPYGNRAYMEGKLTHFNFKDMSVDARLFTDNFLMLNTTYNDNEDFYGKAFGEGTVVFSGLTRNINMDIDMKTKPNTQLSIPLASAGDTKDYNFKFINPYTKDSSVIDVIEPIEIKGINMDFNLEVTPDADLELVLNTESENNMRASGQGNLNLRIDQNKQLSIYGTYRLIEGDYVFSPQNLLNKQFKIENGSEIIWNGKPFEAGLDVDAIYHVEARVDNILEDSSRASQIVPMDVIIHIGGTLNETDVSFGIEPSRTGIIAPLDEVESFLEEIKNDEGEVTTQAISLLLVKRFLPSNSTVFSGTNFSASEFGKTTALELVSNQVSNYLTDAISKLITEVELSFNIIQREDYSLEEPGQTTTVQLDYTQKFINNRLIVNIGGNFEFVDDQSTQGNTIAGDFEVEGLLTEDGRLRGKAFHRTADYDIFNQDRSKTGVSISYQKDFDTIDELFKPDANKKKRRQNKRNIRRDEREDRKKDKHQSADEAILPEE